jgi:glycosyltransferase involved in cell wall biosynthesis
MTPGVPATAPRVTYISWAESCSRSDHTARELGGRSHMVYAAKYGSRAATIVLKYAAQWRQTARILAAENPDAVFVMTPPLFASLPAFLYARRRGAIVVLDAHTAAFAHPRWKYWQWAQRALCRRAATTIVHNEHIAGIVRGWGAHATVVADVPVLFDRIEPFARPKAMSVAVVCSFNYDEPLPAIIDAAAKVPDIRFYVTGNPKHLAPDLKARMPPNMTLTGFLSTEAYGGLITGADAVLTLTTRNHTMLRAAYEAVYQGTPVIVSDWPLLRDAFPEGAEHVDNSADAIARAVRAMEGDLPRYREGAARQKALKQERWSVTLNALLSRLDLQAR